MNKKKTIIVCTALLVTIFILVTLSVNHSILKMRVKYNLWSRYGINVSFNSFIVNDDYVKFVCSTKGTDTYVFSGRAYSGNGTIDYENYIGAIIGELDACFLEERMQSSFDGIYIWVS